MAKGQGLAGLADRLAGIVHSRLLTGWGPAQLTATVPLAAMNS